MFPGLDIVIRELVSRTIPSETVIVEQFFQDFLGNQLNNLRPGFAHYIAESILKFHANLCNDTF